MHTTSEVIQFGMAAFFLYIFILI